MSSKRFFVTGTDTEVGKTLVTSALLYAARQCGLQTLGLKPVAAGCEKQADGWRNDDALALQQQTTVSVSYEEINPYALKAAIAPHIAARQENIQLSAEEIATHCRKTILQAQVGFILVEGAGGWYVPLNKTESLADVAKQIEAPVILVVAIKLGCINHALLTAEAITQSGLSIAGWVANCIDPNALAQQKNIDTLQHKLDVPCIGTIPHLVNATDVGEVANYLDLNALL